MGGRGIELVHLNSVDEMQKVLDFIEALERLGLDDILSSNPLVLKLLCCMMGPSSDAGLCSRLQMLAEQLADNLKLGRDPLVWLLLPPALASLGQFERAQDISIRLVNSFANDWMREAYRSDVDTLSEEWQRIVDGLHNYSLVQICLASPRNSQRRSLMNDLISACADLNFLMQMLVLCVRQNVEDDRECLEGITISNKSIPLLYKNNPNGLR